MRSFLRLAGAALMIVLLALLLAPGGTIEAEEIIWDKAAHFIAFGLILWSLGVLFRRLHRVVAAGLAVVIGAAVEVLQGYVGRDPSWGDLLADILGVGTALLMWVVWRRFKPREAFHTSNPDTCRVDPRDGSDLFTDSL